MHNHFSRWVVTIVMILLAGITLNQAKAVDSNSWITSALYLQKQADTTALPPTVSGNGNIDCNGENVNDCSIATNYGAAASASAVRFNSSDSFIPVFTYIDGRQHFFPVPNSDVAMSYYSGPVYGLNIAFNYNLASSVTPIHDGYIINKPPDQKLSDKNGHLLAADTLSTSFSENGRWMVVSDPNVAMLRVNMQTFEVLPFAPGFNYTIGLDPSVKTAISNDGQYALVASHNFSTFKIYDLNSCSTVPSTINGPVTCQSRDLRAFMQSQLPGFSFVANGRFLNNDSVTIYAVYNSGNINKTARFLINDNSLTHQIDYLAIGDSYISGEGAFDYMGGTDTDVNECHVSFLAYPFLIGRSLNFNYYHSVACSGAATNDVINTSSDYRGQMDHIKRADRADFEVDSIIASFQPGYIAQLDFVKTYQPQIVTLSVGGNDMGFSKILLKCVEPKLNNTCYSTYEDRLELVRQINTVVYPRLVQTYQKIKAAGPPDARIYVVGYPQIAKPGGDCGLNVHLNSDEVLFSQELISYLDTVVKAAATKAGVYYVDAQDALYGHRLCEAKPGSIAVNGLTAGNDRPKKLHGPIGDESYHPNFTGYQLMANKILSVTHNLTTPMPAPNFSVTLPPEGSLEILNVTHTNRNMNKTEYSPNLAPDLAYQQIPFDISIDGSQTGLTTNSAVKAELHSTPTTLGSFTTNANGDLAAQINIPAATTAGYHTLHFYGTNITGQPIDIYKDIFVAKSADDIDGNGILDTAQKCIGVDAANIDYDKDGIDDACDGNITEPPVIAQSDTPQKETSDTQENSVNNSPSNLQSSNIIPKLRPIIAPKGIPAGLDSSQIFTTSDLAVTNEVPKTLGTNINKLPKITQTTLAKSKRISSGFWMGIVLVLAGTIGLLFRRVR